nr:CASP-like protein PIMP1 [Nicotiana tomentosiformis]
MRGKGLTRQCGQIGAAWHNMRAKDKGRATRFVVAAMLQTSAVTLKDGDKLNYDHYRSYSYTLFAVIAGVVYSILHIPFAIYFLITKKRLISHKVFRVIEFYCDKIILCLLATGAAAMLGATMDLLRIRYENDNSKKHDFLNLMFIPPAFLLAGFVGSGISSVLSSFSLHKE